MAERYTTIEIGEQDCKISQLARHKGRIMLERLMNIPLPPMKGDEKEPTESRVAERAAALKKAFKQYKISTTHITLVLPKNLVTTRLIRLPSIDPQEIKEMARFEAERHIPFNFERYAFSHHVINSAEIEGSEVMIAAADSAVYEDSITTIVQAGLKIDGVDISTLGLYNYFLFMKKQQPESLQTPAQNQNNTNAFSIPMINIGNATTDFVIIQNDKLLFNRSCTVGISRLLDEIRPYVPQNITDEDLVHKIDFVEIEKSVEIIFGVNERLNNSESTTSTNKDPDESNNIQVIYSGKDSTQIASVASIVRDWLKRLLGEIRRSYDFAKREFDCYPASLAYLSGEGAALTNIQQFLNINLGIEIFEINPLNDFTHDDKFETYRPAQPSLYVQCLGSAVRYFTKSGILLDLIPATYLKKANIQQRRASLMTHGIMIFAIILLLGVYIHQQMTHRQRLLEWYSQKNKQLKPQVTDIVDKEKKLKIIQRHIYDERSALNILDTFSAFAFIPERVTLTNFKFVKDEYVELNGHAMTIPDLNNLLTELEKTGYFSLIELKAQEKQQIRGRNPEIYSFKIFCELKR